MSHHQHHHPLHHHQQQQQQQPYNYHQVNPNSWYPNDPAHTGPHLQQQQQLYNSANAVVVASPNVDAAVIGASNSAASSPVGLRPDVVSNQQRRPVTQSNANTNTNYYHQPGTYQEPTTAIYQSQQDYYNHRPIESFQHHQSHHHTNSHPHPLPFGWTTPNAPAADQTTSSPQIVANVSHLHITHGLMEQASGPSSPYSTGVSSTINQHTISATTSSYTNGYSHQQHYQQPDNVHQIQQQNNSNHNAIIQPSLQHNQEDIYANQCHLHNDHDHHNTHHPLHHAHEHAHHIHTQINSSRAQTYNSHQQQRGSPVILMHSGTTSATTPITKQDSDSDSLQAAGNDQMQHVAASGNQLYPMSSRTVVNPQHYQQKVGIKQGMSIVRGHLINPCGSQQAAVATNLSIHQHQQQQQQQQQQLIGGNGSKGTQVAQPALPLMSSTGSGEVSGQICRTQSSSVISSSSMGSNSNDHLSPTELNCAPNQTGKFSIIIGHRVNPTNMNETKNIKSEPDNEVEDKDSELSRLHQECAILLGEHLNAGAKNSSTNSNNNGRNASNSGTNKNNNSAQDIDPHNPTSDGNNTVRCKRLRTSFKHNQLKEMKRWFSKNQNPDAKDLKTLAQTTGLSKRVLQVWFQNSRAKFRRNNPKIANQQHYGSNHQQHAPHLLQYQQQHQQTNQEQPATVYHNHDHTRPGPPAM